MRQSFFSERQVATKILLSCGGFRQFPRSVYKEAHHGIARRRNLRLDDLTTEAWVLPPIDSTLGSMVAQAFFSPRFAAENPTIMDWYRAHYLANDPANYVEIMNDLGAFDSTDRLAEISCPTLIVAGDSDGTSVAGDGPLDSAMALHQRIKRSELAVIEGAHHYPHIDHVDPFNARVLAFLSGTAAETHPSAS